MCNLVVVMVSSVGEVVANVIGERDGRGDGSDRNENLNDSEQLMERPKRLHPERSTLLGDVIGNGMHIG